MQGRYIVLFQRNEADPPGLARGLGAEHGFSPELTFSRVVRGFSARMSQQAVEALRRNPRVQLVEPDGVVTMTEAGSQSPVTWGLDRIDQRNPSLDDSYSWGNDGTGVHAYILDTGIRTTHLEFAGRATFDVDFTGDRLPNDGDCQGHGTHVAGTVGGSSYGVAKNVRLHAVRVLDCGGSGWWSWVIGGLEWVADHQDAPGDWPAVVNMSLSGGVSASVNAAVAGAVADGVVVVVAAGNDSGDACTKSPASAPDALTVGSSTSSDSRSSFSNMGTCVDLFAPGSSITSSTQNTISSIGTWSGTSMASPHVAGVAALYLGDDSNLSPDQVMRGILGNATPDVLFGVGTGSPNLLLYSEVGEVPLPPEATLGHVSALSVSVNFGNRNSNGTATVTVVDQGDGAVSGATVIGDWKVNGSVMNGGTSGVTDDSGVALVESGALKKVSTGDNVQFCVTDVTGTGLEYNSGANVVSCAGPDGGEGELPPTTPEGFTLSASVKANKDVNLSWEGSSAKPFNVFWSGQTDGPIGSTDGSTFAHIPGQGNWTYQVCDAAVPSNCTDPVQVITKR